MRDLFEILVAEGEAAVRQLRDERRMENVELEFKTKQRPENGEVTKDDRDNLAEALCALANSMGGVIVWGVRARMNADRVDCADELVPISDLSRFASEINRLLSQVIMPRHDGIRMHAIPSQEQKGAGYLVIRVERSERRPHRTEVGNKQYYKRIVDSSIAMEHYDIEDSFKRFTVSVLVPELQFRSAFGIGGPERRTVRIDVAVLLKNESSVSARYPYFVIDNFAGSPPTFDIRTRRSFYGGANDVVHPEISIPSVAFSFEVMLFPSGSDLLLSRGQFASTVISYRCGSYNSRPTKGTLEFSAAEIAAVIPNCILS